MWLVGIFPKPVVYCHLTLHIVNSFMLILCHIWSVLLKFISPLLELKNPSSKNYAPECRIYATLSSVLGPSRVYYSMVVQRDCPERKNVFNSCDLNVSRNEP